ncbi:MAG: flagellar biosynthesis protein FlhA [Pseudomonadota bacterium]
MVPGFILTLLAMMMVPLPPLALDTLFTFNIALSLAILLTAVYVERPLEFGVFPTVLLLVTLLRLALNIASTRIVLLHGHTGNDAAGQVIKAFGDFVAGGDYAVGIIVFAILVIINFVVVTKGAGRISEVTARFTLDAMPGKQMAIDADLNAGLIDQTTAKQRRQEIREEADFYGAMDGASKFVRGDAVAGILILFINIIGGLAIGTATHDLALADAMRNYTLLTIGDGLVAQVPSLLLSTAVAVIVTRVSRAESMSQQVLGQLLSNPRTFMMTGGVLLTLGLIPGMPNLAFLALAGACFFAGKRLSTPPSVSTKEEEDIDTVETPPQPVPELTWDDINPVDSVGLEVGYRLIPLVDKNAGGPLIGRIKGVRKKLTERFGFLIPAVHIRDNLDLQPSSYRVTLMGVTVGEGDVMVDKELAINPGQVYGKVEGIATRDPAFGLEAYWINTSQNEEAQMYGYTVVDPATVVATHLSQLLTRNAHELLGHEEVEALFERLAERSPKLVEELTPKLLPMAVIVKTLQSLLAEGIAISNLKRIAECLAENAVRTQDPDLLAAAARVVLGRSIVQNITGLTDELPVATLDSELVQLLENTTSSGEPMLEPGLLEKLHTDLATLAERQETAGEPAVLLVAPKLRPWLARALRSIRNLHVLAYSEIPDDKRIRMIEAVSR